MGLANIFGSSEIIELFSSVGKENLFSDMQTCNIDVMKNLLTLKQGQGILDPNSTSPVKEDIYISNLKFI